MKGKEVVQEGVDADGEEMKVSLHRFDDPGKGPWGYGKAEGKVLEHIAVSVYEEGQELVEVPVDGDMVKRIREVQCATPKGRHHPRRNLVHSLHAKGWFFEELVQSLQVYYETECARLVLDHEETGEEQGLRMI